MKPQRSYKVEEVQQLLKDLGIPFTRQHIRRLCCSEQIQAVKVGRRWFIPESFIENVRKMHSTA